VKLFFFDRTCCLVCGLIFESSSLQAEVLAYVEHFAQHISESFVDDIGEAWTLEPFSPIFVKLRALPDTVAVPEYYLRGCVIYWDSLPCLRMKHTIIHSRLTERKYSKAAD
jgi:hypothetical protein